MTTNFLKRAITTFGIVLSGVALISGSVNVNAQTAAPTKDIVDTAVAAGNFTSLVAAVKAADLVTTLKGTGPFTVFAPTDAAFAKLPADTVKALLSDPAKKSELASILTYHVVAGSVDASQVVKLSSAKTVQGQDIKITVRNGEVFLNDNVKVVTTDIKATNGIIHVIDTVLMPTSMNATASMTSNMSETVRTGGFDSTTVMTLGAIAMALVSLVYVSVRENN